MSRITRYCHAFHAAQPRLLRSQAPSQSPIRVAIVAPSSVAGAAALEQRDDVARSEWCVVGLDPAHLLDGQAIRAIQVDLLADPFGPKARVPFLGNE